MNDTIDLPALAQCIKQAWVDDYPPELEPHMVKGRKMWRKKHLVELIRAVKPSFAALAPDIGPLE